MTVEVFNVSFGGDCPAIPHTVFNLGLWVDNLPVTALRGLLRYLPSRLTSIFLSVHDWTGSRAEAASLVRSLHVCVAPRIRALELDRLLSSLDLHSSAECAQFFRPEEDEISLLCRYKEEMAFTEGPATPPQRRNGKQKQYIPTTRRPAGQDRTPYPKTPLAHLHPRTTYLVVSPPHCPRPRRTQPRTREKRRRN